MNLTEDYTFKKIQREKATKSLSFSYDQLCKQHEKLDKKLQDISKEFKDCRAKSDTQERELLKKQRAVEKLIEEKCELNQIITENKNHIRKLESKIAIGLKGSADISINKQLYLSSAEKKALENELNEAYEKIQELEDNISVISQALDLKAN